MTDNKQLIIQPKVGKNQLVKFVNNLEEEGIKTVFADPRILKKTKIQTIFPSQDANYVILDKEATKKSRGKKVGRRFRVSSNKDIEKIMQIIRRKQEKCFLF